MNLFDLSFIVANGNPEVEIKIEEASSAEELANKPSHDTGEEKPAEKSSSEEKTPKETRDSKVEENDKNNSEETKEQMDNEISSKSVESTKENKDAEQETPVVVELAEGGPDTEKSGTDQDTVVEEIDHDQSKSTENSTQGGTTSTNEGAADANVVTDGTTGEGTEEVGHIDNGKQNEDVKVEGVDQDQLDSKTEENISMNEDKPESNAGIEESIVKTDNYDVTNKDDTPEDSAEMKEPEVGGKIDVESSGVTAQQEPSDRTAEKEGGSFTKTDEKELLESEEHENTEVSRDSKEIRGSQEMEEDKEGTQDSMKSEVESSKQDNVESNEKRSLEEGEKLNGEAKDTERGSEEQQYEPNEHTPERQRDKGDKELQTGVDREQERKSVVEMGRDADADSASVSQKSKKSSRRERSSTASSDKSTRRSRRRSSKGSLEERRLRDFSSERRGKYRSERNEHNAHFQGNRNMSYFIFSHSLSCSHFILYSYSPYLCLYNLSLRCIESYSINAIDILLDILLPVP